MTEAFKRATTLIVGADSNAHHTIWGSSDISQRGESLLDLISNNNLTICNTGDEPSFITAVRREVLDVTLSGSPNLFNVVNIKQICLMWSLTTGTSSFSLIQHHRSRRCLENLGKQTGDC